MHVQSFKTDEPHISEKHIGPTNSLALVSMATKTTLREFTVSFLNLQGIFYFPQGQASSQADLLLLIEWIELNGKLIVDALKRRENGDKIFDDIMTHIYFSCGVDKVRRR